MRGDAIFVLAVLFTSLVLFVTERLALEIVALLVVLALILGGGLPPADALAGFSDPLVVTIGALFVVGVAVQETGLGAALGGRLARVAAGGEARLIAATMLAAASLSAPMGPLPRQSGQSRRDGQPIGEMDGAPSACPPGPRSRRTPEAGSPGSLPCSRRSPECVTTWSPARRGPSSSRHSTLDSTPSSPVLS